MTLDARRGAVRPEQREAFHVVREAHIFPGFQRVADLAPNGAAIAAILGAQLAELAAMRFGMAGTAGTVVEVEAHRGGLPSLRFMALGALHGSMSSGQLEASGVVASDGERGVTETLNRVAIVAVVQMRRTGKLRLVRIFVAVQAGGELQPKGGGFASRHMALGADHAGVFALQRKRRCRVVAYREPHRLETFHGVAGAAFTFVRALRELLRMRVRLVAIRTFAECQGPLEVAAGVAFQAVQLGMFALERKLCPRVTELVSYVGAFPAAGVVARFAGVGEGTAMRIAVAIVAVRER